MRHRWRHARPSVLMALTLVLVAAVAIATATILPSASARGRNRRAHAHRHPHVTRAATTTSGVTTTTGGATTTTEAATTTVPGPTTTPPPAGGSGAFAERFDGVPTTPQAFGSDDWDVLVHVRDDEAMDNPPTVHAGHGSTCSAPPATHVIQTYEDVVFRCRDHVMTAIDGSPGYGLVTLTPDHMVDFASGEAVVRFDMSTLRSNGRDWVELWVTPFADNLVGPTPNWAPDLVGAPRRALQLQMSGDLSSAFNAFVYRNHQPTGVDSRGVGYTSMLTPDAARRDTFELRISRTHVKFGMPAYDLWWTDADVPAFDWTRGIVQLQQHSYTPYKDCESGPRPGCGPNTWHWDNVSIDPAVPFDIIHADRPLANEQRPAMTLAAPAPAGASLRFEGIGENLQVSFDGGATWTTPRLQPQRKTDAAAMRSFFTPIPAGTRTLRFRGGMFAGNHLWRVEDVTVWAP